MFMIFKRRIIKESSGQIWLFGYDKDNECVIQQSLDTQEYAEKIAKEYGIRIEEHTNGV